MKILNLKRIILLLLIFFPFVTNAAGLGVTFEKTPLFSESNISPGNTVSREIVVSNGDSVNHDVYIQLLNLTNSNFSNVLNVHIYEGTNQKYIGSLTNLYNDGRVFLSTLSASENTTYSFSITLKKSANNSYQGEQAGFDICLGFEGGATTCDGSSGGSSGGSITSTSGGSGSILSSGGTTNILQILNEEEYVTSDTSGIITWQTTLPASDKVVYGLKSGGPYYLNLDDPYYGYPQGTIENFFNRVNHQVSLSNLISGEIYVYRVVSRENPGDLPNISGEHELNLSSPITNNIPNFVEDEDENFFPNEIIGGEELPQTESPLPTQLTSVTVDEEGYLNLVASAFLAFQDAITDFLEKHACIVNYILMVSGAVLGSYILHKVFKWGIHTSYIIWLRRIISISIILALEIVLALIFDLKCSVIPLLIIESILLISLIPYTYFGKRGSI